MLLVVANLANIKCCKEPCKMIETLAHGYSYESAQRELSDEYQHGTGLDSFQILLRFLRLGRTSSQCWKG